MNTGALRRRVHHEDVGGRRNERLEFGAGADGLDEPLLGQDRYETARASYVDDDSDDDWREKKSREEQAWTQNLSRLIALWAQWFTNAVVGGGAWVGSTLFQLLLRRQANDSQTVEEIYLSPIQAERLENLQQRLSVPFDGSRAEHQDALRALWRSAFPGRALPGLVSEQWKEMGWQGTDPSTDFRGGGFISLQNLLFFSRKFPDSFQRLLHKQEGKRATWEYPFAVAGLNISFMLIQMLDLKAAKPTSMSGITFLKILAGCIESNSHAARERDDVGRCLLCSGSSSLQPLVPFKNLDLSISVLLDNYLLPMVICIIQQVCHSAISNTLLQRC
ncbi:hypothetical protein CY35_10G042500 [Sphagnum magellanicum]|nr:hypothetical protein CY35_10G042500 [Sphagnum magellanicum]